MHDISARVRLAFEREQLVVIAAQMRGAIEHVGDEGRLTQGKGIEC